MIVKKRTGEEAQFDKNKIIDAILKSMKPSQNLMVLTKYIFLKLNHWYTVNLFLRNRSLLLKHMRIIAP